MFAEYATGTAAVLLLVAVSTAAAETALTRRITALPRYGPRVTAAVMVVTGAYLAWYWYPTATNGATTASSSGGLARFSAIAFALGAACSPRSKRTTRRCSPSRLTHPPSSNRNPAALLLTPLSQNCTRKRPMSTAPTNSNQTGGLARRIAGRLLTATLAALGTVVTLLGAGLSLIGCAAAAR